MPDPMSDPMPAPSRTAFPLFALIGVAALSGCRSWEIVEEQPLACRCPQANVLAELGIATPDPALVAAAGSTRAPGPSLIAGDGIAWGWAIAYGLAPEGETPAWTYAGVITD